MRVQIPPSAPSFSKAYVPPPAWTFQGTINTQELQPGETLRAAGVLRIVSPTLQEAGQMRVEARLSIERLLGQTGSARSPKTTLHRLS